MILSKRALVAAPILAALCLSIPALLAASGEKLKQVSPEFVCMANKRHFGKELKPVVVEGRTYYACCDMCAKELQEKSEARKDIDPVSGKTVDKATAAVGVDKDGKVYFFENVENLRKFRVPDKQEKAPAF